MLSQQSRSQTIFGDWIGNQKKKSNEDFSPHHFWVSDFKVRRAAGDQTLIVGIFRYQIKSPTKDLGIICKMSLQLLEMNTCL